jgi:hypothetical protein
VNVDEYQRPFSLSGRFNTGNRAPVAPPRPMLRCLELNLQSPTRLQDAILTEMGTRNLPGGKGRPASGADNLTAICEPIF